MQRNSKQKISFGDQATQVVAGFVGSWWAVMIHFAWFAVWLIWDLGEENLTLWVSLEAIFIGIFLLMAANKEEDQRRLAEARRQKRQLSDLKADLILDEKAERRLVELGRLTKEIKADLEEIKKAARS